jgi:hypothetical protein
LRTPTGERHHFYSSDILSDEENPAEAAASHLYRKRKVIQQRKMKQSKKNQTLE